jgi:hypothetical protein
MLCEHHGRILAVRRVGHIRTNYGAGDGVGTEPSRGSGRLRRLLHWDFVCDVLTGEAAARLAQVTRRVLDALNAGAAAVPPRINA